MKPVQAQQSNLRPFAADPREVILALDAKRFQYAFMFDPLLAMSTSKVDPLPHQIEAVYGYLLKKPQIRFLLAHDPGAGKTIMAGLLVKELKLRGLVERVLVVVPGQLKEQWRWEMEDKFDEDFEVVGRESYNERGRAGVWNGPQLITSLDFAKRADILDSLEAARFDLIIVDEAHKMSAYSTGRITTKTQRYRLGETLSVISRHMLFLTATPHKGDPANFRLLLDLLEPGYFSADGMIQDSVDNQDNPLFLRRAKEDMADFDGRPLFVPREVHTPDAKLSPPERTLYNAMSRYVQEQYNLAMQATRGHNITFALIILQRRFASSTYALRESLKRRKARLEELERSAGMVSGMADGADIAAQMERMDEMSESERWDEEKKWEVLSLAQNTEELRQEIDVLEGLIGKAEKVIRRGSETKLTQLRKTLEALDREQPDEKILVFTEAKDTLDYLVSKITSWGYTVNNIHGAMAPKARKDAEAVFRDQTRIMVATEAAGEGINLQFCHLMVNYDLPWNPNRLEQRMGRIHRYGQRSPVHVFNMVAADTREGQIMQTLFAKLLEIKSAVGSDKVFDVISDIVPGKSLSQLLLEATVRSRSQATIIKDLGRILDADGGNVQDYLKDSLASKYLDQTVFRDQRDAAREGQLAPHHARGLFSDIMEWGGGEISERGGGLVSITPPAAMGHRPKSYPAATFEKRVRMAHPGVDLITFGHPLFDSALRWAKRRCSDAAMAGGVFTDPAGRLAGILVFCEGSIKDGTGRRAGRQMVACHVDGSGGVRDIPAAALLDLEPGGDPGEVPDTGEARRLALGAARRSLAALTKSIQRDRNRQAAASQKYGIRSIDNILAGIGDDMEALLDKKAKGTKVDLAIHNKRKERRRYRQARQEMKERIILDSTLESGAPLIVGMALVVPGQSKEVQRSQRAFQAAMQYEKKHGRIPEDTAGTGSGFDIRSAAHPSKDAMSGQSGAPETRYIISKAGADDTVVLTRNEWRRAMALGDDCYLYVHRKRRLSWRVLVVRNPAGTLPAVETGAGYGVDISGAGD